MRYQERVISLNGIYDLYFYDANLYSVAKPDALDHKCVTKIRSVVPSNVEFALCESGFLPKDLNFGKNVFETRKFEQYDFWYATNFSINEKDLKGNIRLDFYGVDTVAEYFINGEKIGESKNMFVKHSFAVNKYLRVGKNRLHVKLASDIKYLETKEFPPYLSALPTNYESLWLRKAPHVFGWDIFPRCLSRGIWREIKLVIEPEIDIENIYLAMAEYNPEQKFVNVFFKYDLKLPSIDYYKYNIKLKGICGNSQINYSKQIYFKSGYALITLTDYKLWYPRGYGKQNLYDVEVSICNGDSILVVKRLRFGLREVNIVKKRKDGRDGFLVQINRVPIMIKGVNWSGADFLHARDKEKNPKLLESIDELNANCVRCWGGSVYEDDDFYSFCDEHGILIWQDFSMACAQYPMEEEFTRELGREVREVCKALKNHPSLLLYCGDNECDIFLANKNVHGIKNKLTRELLPEMVFREDPYAEFLYTSPYWSEKYWKNRDFIKAPELHLWGVRDYFKSDFYRNPDTQFISEIGYAGCNTKSTLKKYISKNKLWPLENNDEWMVHSTVSEDDVFNTEYSYRIPLLVKTVKSIFGELKGGLDEFITASQIVQAEGVKFFAEFSRQRKWDRSGIIIWNLNDGWAEVSEALIDYYGEKKLAYYVLKNSYRDVQLIIEEVKGWYSSVTILNDGNEDYLVDYEVKDIETEEIVMSGQAFSKANENLSVGLMPVSAHEKKMYLLKCSYDGKIVYNHYLQGLPPFDLGFYKKNFNKISKLVYGVDLTEMNK